MSRPSADQDEEGKKIITKDFLKRLCIYNQAYETPKLNTHLYLHYMGLSDIRNLEDYINLRALWLENNHIEEINNLSSLSKLRFLYLQNNSIKKIENLDNLKELTALNLSHNQITVIENLSELKVLEDLDLSHNKLQFSFSLRGLKQTPSIKALDLRENIIEDSEFLLETLKSMPELRCLVIKGNPCLKNISNYRKTFTADLKKLNFLDEKMISDVERLACQAWLEHGKEAEMQVRKKFFEAKEEEVKKGLQEFGAYEKVFADQKEQKMRKILKERQDEKVKILEERKKVINGLVSNVEERVQEINEWEARIEKPIQESELVDFYLQPGKVVYQSGNFDHFGNTVEAEKAQGVLKDLNELKMNELEELLVYHEFDFQEVWEVLSHDYNCTTETLRSYWWDYSNSLETFEELE
jgi:dynein assembly factor 1